MLMQVRTSKFYTGLSHHCEANVLYCVQPKQAKHKVLLLVVALPIWYMYSSYVDMAATISL